MSVAIGKEHIDALTRYIEGLRETNSGLPSRSGKVNVAAVATACGFNREVLYQNPHCRQLLADAAKTIGLRGVEHRDDSGDADKVKLERRITNLEQQNAVLVAEVHELRRQLTLYRHIEEMLEAGKRVIL